MGHASAEDPDRVGFPHRLPVMQGGALRVFPPWPGLFAFVNRCRPRHL